MSRSWTILSMVTVVMVGSTNPATAQSRKNETVAWNVRPDPLPWKMEASFKEGKAVPLPGNSTVLFPTTASPFAAIVSRGDKTTLPELSLLDLRTLEPVGKPVRSEGIDTRFLKVSPFGDLYASYDTKAELPTILVWSAKGEPVVPSIAIHDEKLKIEALDFAGPGQVLTVKEIRKPGQRARRLWEVWDAKTGKRLTSIHYQLEYHIKWISFTPGRKYLMMQETGGGYHVLFWDLATGQLAGKIAMQGPKDHWGQCGGLTVSADGKEAALIWRLHKEGILAKIMRFDLEKGTKIGEHILRDEILPSDRGFLVGGPRTFQFLPDGRGWLVSGHQIVDRETGKIVWAIPPVPRFERAVDRRFADGYHVSAQSRDRKLTMIALPRDELDAAFKKSRAK